MGCAAVVAALVGATPAVAAARAPVARGAVFLVPATAPASSSGNTVRMAYVAPGGGMHGGVLSIRVPPGWTRPQHRTARRPGYVSAGGGSLRIAGRTIVLRHLDLCGGCSVVVEFADARAPAAGRSVFLARSALTGDGPRAALAIQPGVTLTGPAGAAHRTGAAAVPLGDYAGSVDPSGIAAFGSATGTHPTLATDY
ncbi:MAG TPA: hypothetical protein VMB72_06460, partial [Acidimicrobiales bacterium]|nr:hypothetical protein [Acidimicrobiales bacterium]